MVKFTKSRAIIAGAISILTTTSNLSLVSASNICAYTSRSCIGTYGCCSNIGARVCCTYPANYGWSTFFSGMPTGWYGYMYGDTCSTVTGGISSSNGQACLTVNTGSNYLAAKSASWTVTSARRSAVEIMGRNASDCAEVDTFGFTGKDGKVVEVKIPPGTTFAELEELAEQGKFDELLKLGGY